MREILFRAKSVWGNWCEGYPVKMPKYFRMSTRDDLISFGVDAETIGQFTGLTDKNGKKIFEGDIVRILGNQQVEDWKNVNYTALIAFLDGGFCAIDGTIENHGFRRYGLSRLDFDLEVIGNIHDNPELLED